MYSRYHSMRHKAIKANLPFEWITFIDFFNFVVETCPEYHPATHRFRFDVDLKDPNGIPYGYSTATFGVIKTKAVRTREELAGTRTVAAAEERAGQEEGKTEFGDDLCQLQAELCVQLLSGAGSLSAMKANALEELNRDASAEGVERMLREGEPGMSEEVWRNQ
jgi:hypothetical protein